jgi:hypothetical protein
LSCPLNGPWNASSKRQSSAKRRSCARTCNHRRSKQAGQTIVHRVSATFMTAVPRIVVFLFLVLLCHVTVELSVSPMAKLASFALVACRSICSRGRPTDPMHERRRVGPVRCRGHGVVCSVCMRVWCPFLPLCFRRRRRSLFAPPPSFGCFAPTDGRTERTTREERRRKCPVPAAFVPVCQRCAERAAGRGTPGPDGADGQTAEGTGTGTEPPAALRTGRPQGETEAQAGAQCTGEGGTHTSRGTKGGGWGGVQSLVRVPPPVVRPFLRRRPVASDKGAGTVTGAGTNGAQGKRGGDERTNRRGEGGMAHAHAALCVEGGGALTSPSPRVCSPVRPIPSPVLQPLICRSALRNRHKRGKQKKTDTQRRERKQHAPFLLLRPSMAAVCAVPPAAAPPSLFPSAVSALAVRPCRLYPYCAVQWCTWKLPSHCEFIGQWRQLCARLSTTLVPEWTDELQWQYTDSGELCSVRSGKDGIAPDCSTPDDAARHNGRANRRGYGAVEQWRRAGRRSQ